MPGFRSFLDRQETEFGLKPIIRINHIAVREGSEGAVVASKMLYASHYFWTGLELRALLPDSRRGPGFWFITVNRSRFGRAQRIPPVSLSGRSSEARSKRDCWRGCARRSR